MKKAKIDNIPAPIVVGALATALIRRESRSYPDALEALRAAAEQALSDDGNKIYYLRDDPSGAACSIMVLVHDDALDAYPGHALMISGMIEDRAGMTITEDHISYGSALPATILQDVLAGRNDGRVLSEVIGSRFGDHDPVLGNAYSREDFGTHCPAIDFAPSFSRHESLDLAIGSLTSSPNRF